MALSKAFHDVARISIVVMDLRKLNGEMLERTRQGAARTCSAGREFLGSVELWASGDKGN